MWKNRSLSCAYKQNLMQVMSLSVTANLRLIYCLSNIVEGKWKTSRVSRELRLANERNTCQMQLPKVKVRTLRLSWTDDDCSFES
ncbi:hypothetical protein P5673_017431 [Acropora cervicornis]|uniref:Uncharacterized protein n=1 Tax=Acropora cervicornis TaxID=6130 RepID=A0AAD9QEU2_ACRCE|nr:hypothetical protein P5673_017431 [Acropora cervicornis]